MRRLSRRPTCSRDSSSRTRPARRSLRFPAGSASASFSPWPWSTIRRCSCSTSRPPGSIRSRGGSCTRSSASCGPAAAPSCSARIILRRRTNSATAWGFFTRAGFSPRPRLFFRAAAAVAAAELSRLPGVTAVQPQADGSCALATNAAARTAGALAHLLTQAGIELLDLRMDRPSLEDVFLELTGSAWTGNDAEAPR